MVNVSPPPCANVLQGTDWLFGENNQGLTADTTGRAWKCICDGSVTSSRVPAVLERLPAEAVQKLLPRDLKKLSDMRNFECMFCCFISLHRCCMCVSTCHHISGLNASA